MTSCENQQYFSGRNLNIVFSIFILRYVESKFTVLTYLMENQRDWATAKQNKSLSLPYTTSPLKAEFFILLKGVNFCGLLFCRFFFLRELIFADRGQSAKFAKIKTRKIFMLHGIVLGTRSKPKPHVPDVINLPKRCARVILNKKWDTPCPRDLYLETLTSCHDLIKDKNALTSSLACLKIRSRKLRITVQEYFYS